MQYIPDSTFFIAILSIIQDGKIFEYISHDRMNTILLIDCVDEEIKDTENYDRIQEFLEKGIVNFVKLKENKRFHSFSEAEYSLHEGEKAVLYCGLSKKTSNSEYICIIDEKKARKFAQEHKLELIGTVGILNNLVSEGSLSAEQRKSYLDVLRDSGFRLPKKI